MTGLTIEKLHALIKSYDAGSPNQNLDARDLAEELFAVMQENERLRIELRSACNQLELLAYTSAGNDHGLSRFCAGLVGHIKLALNQNEV